MSEVRTGTVSFDFDPEHPTAVDPARLVRLKAMRDEDIDLSDIPEAPADAVWRRANGRFGVVDRVTLEEDVLEFFRQSDDLPKRVNEVLREYAEAHRKRA